VTAVEYADYITEVSQAVSSAVATGMTFHCGLIIDDVPNGEEWTFEPTNHYLVTLRRRRRGEREFGGLAINGLDPKSFLSLFGEFLEAVVLLVDIWEPLHWAAKLPLGGRKIRSDLGEWNTVVHRAAVLAAENDLAFFDIEFQAGEQRKFLKFYIPLADLGGRWDENLRPVSRLFELFLSDNRNEIRGIYDAGFLRETQPLAQER